MYIFKKQHTLYFMGFFMKGTNELYNTVYNVIVRVVNKEDYMMT